MPELIRVFEYDYLEIDDQNFKRHHWRSLAHFNARNKNKYFTLYPDGIKFNQYVGAIQAGNLTIEILPKADREDEDKVRWHLVLLKMLKECRFIQVEYPEKAYLQIRNGSLIEAYLHLLLDEIERLLHAGLIKKYRKVERNSTVLKGRMLFSQHIRRNMVHQERFYIQHSIYDREHTIHQILYKALKLSGKIAVNALIRGKANRLLLEFPEMKDVVVHEQTFKKIVLDRKSIKYQQSLLISKMLLLNYRPDITGGEDHVLAMLFDMNKLWEEYVYRQLLKLNTSWEISRQNNIAFWKPADRDPKQIRPDIIIDNHHKGRVIIDTKWKLIDDAYPSDDDLKQMFAYAHYAESNHLFLLYPSGLKTKPAGSYINEHVIGNRGRTTVNCFVLKVPLKWLDEEFSGLDLGEDDFN